MKHTTFSNLYSLIRYSFFQTSPQPFIRSRIGLVIEGFVLLVWGVACAVTPPPQAGNQTVRFGVIGDYGGTAYGGTPDPPMAPGTNQPCASVDQCVSAVASLVKSWNPNFIVTVGDNNYQLGGADTIDQNIGQYYHDFIYPYVPPLGNFGAGSPTNANRFFPSLGNHDWSTPNAIPYFDYFTLPAGPGNERYYDVVIGPVHLFAIDSYEFAPDGGNADTSTSAQYSWLQAKLADPATPGPWKLVFFHHPPYSSGYWYINQMRWGFSGATAVLSGHDHFYERLIVSGLPYFVNGSGGYKKGPPDFQFRGTCPPGAGAAPDCETNSQYRHNADFGAMLVQASPTCINFQFIDRAGTLIDSHTIPNPLPPADYYVRDWTDSPTNGDTGTVPSTHPQFYTTSDVWNRQNNTAGAFNANNQPQNENPKNGPGAAGDNYAFARIYRNSCGNGLTETVTAKFLYSEFGTGSNYQTAGNASGVQLTFAADTVTAANTVQTMPGHLWNLPTTTSTHLCLATEISTPLDPSGPTLLGHAPGWPTTDNMVLNDNNKAQRNMGVYHALMKSRGKWSYYAIVHNAATYKRSMILRYEAPPEVSKSNVQLEVIHPKKRPESSVSVPKMLKSGDTIVLEDMQPGENRWIGVTFESVEGKEGERLPVSFFEVVNKKDVNGFTIAPVPGSWTTAGSDILKFHVSVFARLATLFATPKAQQESAEAARLLKTETLTEQEYVTVFRKQISAMNDVITELLASQQSEDFFAIRTELKTFSTAIQEGSVALALPAHSTLLHKLDAFLTMLQKAKGDPADILQNVQWQSSLFARLPQQKALRCSARSTSRGTDKHQREGGDVEVASKEFIGAYETRRSSNADYLSLINELLPCFRETAKEFGNVVRLDEDIANMVKALQSPTALQKAHHEYLLKLQDVVKKP